MANSLKLQKFLQEEKVSDLDLPPPEELVIFDSEGDVANTLDTLVKKKIQSAPVLNKKDNKFVGMVDLMDFVTYILWMFGKNKKKVDPHLATKSEEMIDFSNLDPFVPVKEDYTLEKAIKVLACSNLHRVAVVSADGITLHSLLSQSEIVKYLHKHGNILLPAGNQSIGDLHLAALGTCKRVFCINEKKELLEAFTILKDQKITGIGVVDDEGVLIGSISISDVHLGVGEFLPLLKYPVKTILESFPRRELVTCTVSESLLNVMEKMANTGVHRIFVIDWEKKPIGLVTNTDIIDAVLSLSDSYDPSWK